jgi:multiple sugar transport system permease protein
MLAGLVCSIGRVLRITVIAVAVVGVMWAFYWVLSRPWRTQPLKPGQVEVTIIHWGDNDEDRIMATLVAEFERAHPNIRVKRINPGDSASVRTKLQTMFAAGAAPDVFQVGFENFADWADKGILHELDGFLEADHWAQSGYGPQQAALDLNDYYGNVLDVFRFDPDTKQAGRGKLFSFAKDFTTVGFYYNRNLFRKAGVHEPLPNWTWDDFHAAAESIGKLDNCYGADFVTWENMVRLFVWTHGADFPLPDANADPAKLNAALQRLRDWFAEGRTLASAKTQFETGQDPFLSGRVGMAGPFGRWKVPTYRSSITAFDWDFAPLPRGEDAANGIFTSAWGMAAGSKHPQEAWKLIRYLCGPQAQARCSDLGLAIPIRRDVATSGSFKTPDAKPENDQGYLDAIEVARGLTWPADPRYLHALRVRLEEIYKSDSRSVPNAMAQVETDWRRFRSEQQEYLRLGRVGWTSIAGVLIVVLVITGLIEVIRWWRRRPGRMALREELAGWAMISPWLVGFAAFTAFPILLSFVLGLTRWSALATLDHAEWVGLDNYWKMLSADQGLRNSLRVTVYYVVLAVPLGQLAALVAALLMNRDVKLSGFFRSAWYLPSVLAGVGMSVLWMWVFHHEHGLLNAMLQSLCDAINGMFRLDGDAAPRPPHWFTTDAAGWAIPAFVIMSLWSIGGTMMIYLAGLKGIPPEMYEAAAIDGARPLRRFWNVTLPMLSPVILFNGVIAIIASLQVFMPAYIMTGGGPGDATRFYVYYLYNQAFDFHEMGYASAMAWLLLLIVLALTLLVLRGSRRLVYYEGLRT